MSGAVLNYKKEWDTIYDKLNHISQYDREGFIKDLSYQVGQIEFFHNNVTKNQTGNPSTSFYKPKKAPEQHQIAYFNLTNGFPKELRGGHWCYIVKRSKSKYLVIPCTSVKDGKIADPDFQVDIEIDDFENDKTTRLQISDMRTVDSQRLYINRGFFDVVTDRNRIMNKVYEYMS